MENEILFAPIDDVVLERYERKRKRYHEAKLLSAVNFYADVQSGSVPSYFLMEAIAPRTPSVLRVIESNYPGLIVVRESMTTSDFPLLTGDVLERLMLAGYRDFPAPWRQFSSVRTLRDFRQVERLAVDGLEGQWKNVPEAAEITYDGMEESNLFYAPRKYANAAKISFEALMNDNLGAFDSIPARLGRGGRRTVNRFVTGLYVGANGPLATVYNASNGNVIAGNAPLTQDSLSVAWGQIRNQRDMHGEPIMVEAAILVVPPSLEVVARNILNAQIIRRTTVGGDTGTELETSNWVTSGISLEVDPYIEVHATNANGATSWFLFASPAVGRPAIEVGFVRGFDEPQLYQKVANTMRAGGGGVAQELGDFETMSQEYKGVIAFGGRIIDPSATIASNGSGVIVP